jgi:hypothetical protein
VKKLIVALTLVVATFAVMGCGSSPEKKPDSAPVAAAPATPAPSAAKYDVVDHKAKAIGSDVPEWVVVYIADGMTGVESLDKYKDKYVFVGEDSGTNLAALRLWAQGFNVAQDLARLVTQRVQVKFAGAAAGSPDDEFGRYFENVVKNSSDATFSGARKETDYWILKRYYKEDGKTVDREVYDYYVLVSIERKTLEKQLNAILDGTKVDTPPTKEQQTAIDRVKESFYEGF